MTLYNAYKPLRNKVKKYALESSLIGLWRYTNHVIDSAPLPDNSWYFKNGYFYAQPREAIFPWQLELILKELIINGVEKGEKSLNSFHRLAVLLDEIHNIINIADKTSLNQSNIFNGVFRIMHQQITWQAGYPFRAMLRYYEIFKQPQLSDLFQEKYGLKTLDLFLIAHLLLASLKNSPYVNPNPDYTEIGIPQDLSKKLIESITIEIDNIREILKSDQKFDHSWAYTQNRIRDFPLLKLKNGMIICPFPDLLRRRLTASLYHDMVKTTNFANPYGKAYENHIFNIITKLVPSSYEIKKETPYYVGKNLKHGFDALIGSDHTCLLIECKTYRAPISATSSLGGEDLDSALNRLTNAVIQAFNNVKDIANDSTQWDLSGRRVVIFIITLETWFSDTPDIVHKIESELKHWLHENKFDTTLLERIEYYTCSADQFEKFCHVVSQVGLEDFLKKTDSKAHSINSALDDTYASHGNSFPHEKIFELIGDLHKKISSNFYETQL